MWVNIKSLSLSFKSFLQNCYTLCVSIYMKFSDRKNCFERNQNRGCLWVQSATEKGHKGTFWDYGNGWRGWRKDSSGVLSIGNNGISRCWWLTGSLSKTLGSKAMWGTDNRTVKRSGQLMPEFLHQRHSPQNSILELAGTLENGGRDVPEAT